MTFKAVAGDKNSLHWVKDVAFRKDSWPLGEEHATLSGAVLRSRAHHLLCRITSSE